MACRLADVLNGTACLRVDTVRRLVALLAELGAEPAAGIAPFQGPAGGDSETGSGLTQRGDEPGGGSLHPRRAHIKHSM